jgi:phage terminase small subunit
MHERFAYLMAEGIGCGEAYKRLNPHVVDPNASGCRVAARPEVKVRIAEIQTEVHSRAVMGIDQKRDLLRQMIEGTVPTKVVRKSDGKVEAVYDRLLALQTDAKISGELEGRQQTDGNALSLTFKMYGRDDKLAPKEWLEAELIPVTKEIEAKPTDLSQYAQEVDPEQPNIAEVVRSVYTQELQTDEAERFTQ